MKKDLVFAEVMELYNHIGEEERHFNELELEYRKLASQWLLVALGAVGFVLSKDNVVPVNTWILVVCICIAASAGIFVLWLLDLKVYHELLHAAFKEGVKLEADYADMLPQIRTNMKNSQSGGDIIKRVIFYYSFSILLLLLIANISVWMASIIPILWCVSANFFSVIAAIFIYRIMTKRSDREF